MSNSVVVANLPSDIDLFMKKRNCENIVESIVDPVLKLPKRILYSFWPPYDYDRSCLFTDLIGPTLSTLSYISLLQFGYNSKIIRAYEITSMSAILTVLGYYMGTCLFIFLTCRLVDTKLRFLDIVTLIGYSFYGCIFSLLVPFAFRVVEDYVFYLSLILFAGLSGIRVLLILLFAIDVPVARFLICGVLGNTHILFVVYTYYFYIHPTYVFGKHPT